MDLFHFQSSFDTLMGVKPHPNQHEAYLYKRTKKYIDKITWVPGVRMIAVVNSLSMYATHKGSDIDLFIVTENNRMWLARFLITMIFWFYGVWRKGSDIAGNFCLSFWIEESAMNLEKIALEDDIYLFFWMYYMKPILADETIWEEFRNHNKKYQFSKEAESYLKFKKGKLKVGLFTRWFLDGLNAFIRFFGQRRSQATYKKIGMPEGVVLSKNMLKFHNTDKRKDIRKKLIHSRV